MNGKRLLLLAAFGALATVCMPSAFASTITNTITVKWNTQSISTLLVTTNYSATGAQQLTAPSIITNANGGTGTCTAAGAGSEASQVANFGSVTPDGTSNYTDCLYKNGANAFVASTDSNGYSLAVAGTTPASGVANPYKLCLLPNPAAGWTAPAGGGAVAVVQTVRVAAPAVTNATACNAVESNKGIDLATLGGTGGTIQASTSGANATTSGANYGGDILLGIPPLASSGAQSVTVTYTLTLN
jgi:hypothetical protein